MTSDAIASARRAADLSPRDADLQLRLVSLLDAAGDDAALIEFGSRRLGEAQPAVAHAAFVAAEHRHPDSARLALVKGLALEGMGDAAGALSSLKRAAVLDPTDLDLVFTVGSALTRLGQPASGVACMARVVDLDFGNPLRHRYGFVFPFLNACDWQARARYGERLLAHARRKIARDEGDFLIDPSIFTFLGASGDVLLDIARYYARHAFVDRAAPGHLTHPARPRDARSVRVGYLSNRLWDHHVGHAYVPLLAAHDRSRIEPILYSVERGDATQARLRQLAPFKAIDYAHPAATAEQVRADGIDVLVDLDGYVNEVDPRLGLAVLARRPAPVQIVYHNYAGPTGAGFVDYIIGDDVLFPAGFENFYDEALIRLPACHYPAALPPVTPTPSMRGDWGISEAAMVFANFGNFYKLEPRVFGSWLRILAAVPGSVLWLNDWGRADAVARLREAARKAGMDPARLIFSPKVDIARHLGRLALADLFLDTFDYASGVSSAFGLWMGLPLLTVDGTPRHDNYARHFGACFNAGTGLRHLSCADEASYEATAIRLGLNRSELTEVRVHLERLRVSGTVFDFEKLAHRLEAAFETAWTRHCAGQRPASFSVE